jgi:hypothetical protein
MGRVSFSLHTRIIRGKGPSFQILTVAGASSGAISKMPRDLQSDADFAFSESLELNDDGWKSELSKHKRGDLKSMTGVHAHAE